MLPTLKKKVMNLIIARLVALGIVGIMTPRTVGVMILEAVRAVTLEVDGVLTLKLIGELALTNGKVTQTIVGRTIA